VQGRARSVELGSRRGVTEYVRTRRGLFILYRYTNTDCSYCTGTQNTGTTRSPWTTRSPKIRLGTRGCAFRVKHMEVSWSAADVRSELAGMTKLLSPQNSFYSFGRIWKNLEESRSSRTVFKYFVTDYTWYWYPTN